MPDRHSLETLQAELARQNESFAAFEQTLRALGDIEFAIPPAFLAELEELCGTQAVASIGMPVGIRG